MQRLKGQTALITGASSGIGKEIAKGMSKEGANVVVNYHSDEKSANKIVEELKSEGASAIAVGADVSNANDVQEMFKKMFDVYGTIDILINNAGIQKDAPLIEMTKDDWEKVIGINLTGQFLCAQAAAKEFIKRGIIKNRSVSAGKIICISSVHEVIPWAGHANYAASKGGVKLLMESMAKELAQYKIRVNSIAPGAIETSINKSVWSEPNLKRKLLKLIPYGRIGTTSDIAKAAIWLASDESDYIHGETLVVDGGMTLYPGFTENE